MPAYRPLTVLLMALVAVATVQLMTPGLGKNWFGTDLASSDWIYAERFAYLWTELARCYALPPSACCSGG